jgi:DNA-binding PadR family transcriptional regulator
MTYAIPQGFAGPRGRCRPHHHHHREGAPWEAFLVAMTPRGRHGGGHRGGPGWGGPGFGGPRGRGPRARRGDVRTAMLLLLNEEPRNGYGLMQEIEERSGGAWRPSPGSVYPALSQLEDEGLVRAETADGGRVFTLTDKGKEAVAERDDATPAPWETFDEEAGTGHREFRRSIGELAGAAQMVFRAGDEGQRARAAEILNEARRALYRILAEDGEEEEGSAER